MKTKNEKVQGKMKNKAKNKPCMKTKMKNKTKNKPCMKTKMKKVQDKMKTKIQKDKLHENKNPNGKQKFMQHE